MSVSSEKGQRGPFSLSCPLPGTAALASGDSHTPRCSICRNSRLGELETGYVLGVGMRKLARDFGFSERAVRRHVRWFGLDLIHVLQDCVDTGADLGARVTPEMALRALDCLERLNQRVGLDGG